METNMQLADALEYLASPTRLEGMETAHPCRPSKQAHRLRPALRGWKPEVESEEERRVAEGLRPALRGWKLSHHK